MSVHPYKTQSVQELVENDFDCSFCEQIIKREREDVRFCSKEFFCQRRYTYCNWKCEETKHEVLVNRISSLDEGVTHSMASKSNVWAVVTGRRMDEMLNGERY